MDNIFLKASAEDIKCNLERLNKFNITPGEGITRVALSDEDMDGRDFIKEIMTKLGMEVREDAIGNIFGRLPGMNSSLTPVWTGSHIDTVLNGGMFDGAVGVIGGLEAVRLIKESGVKHKRDIEVIVFTSEEPTRFGMGCLGSRALAGKLGIEDIKHLIDDNGYSLEQVLLDRNYDLSQFSNIRKEKDSVHAFIEMHIEQAEILERLMVPIGVVTHISAPTEVHVTIKGEQRHAGATPMDIRKDAVAAASEIITEIEQLAAAFDNPSTVATVGKLRVYPNASNVIAGKVELSVDIRSSDFKEKNLLFASLNKFIKSVSSRREVEIKTELLCNDQPKKASQTIVERIKDICKKREIPFHEMVSGAYHDAMLIAEFSPFGMIFVPSKRGISHDKDEWTDYEDIARGTDILAKALYNLSNDEG